VEQEISACLLLAKYVHKERSDAILEKKPGMWLLIYDDHRHYVLNITVHVKFE
jgi:hypothetical protein